jgi:hypothetical protein
MIQNLIPMAPTLEEINPIYWIHVFDGKVYGPWKILLHEVRDLANQEMQCSTKLSSSEENHNLTMKPE